MEWVRFEVTISNNTSVTQTLRDEIEERDIGKVKQSVNYLSTNYINTYILYVITILTKWLFTL